MRYLLLIYEEPPETPMAQEDWATMMGQYGAFTTWLEERGWLRTAAALQDVATATTVSVRDDQRLVTDGPFAETKEQVGGFYLLECENLDEALDWAKKIPLPAGAIEVRPVMDYEAFGAEEPAAAEASS